MSTMLKHTPRQNNRAAGILARERTSDRIPPVAEPAQPSYEQIRTRAYEISCSRNGGPGDEVSDWLLAERELSGGSGVDSGVLDGIELRARARGERVLSDG